MPSDPAQFYSRTRAARKVIVVDLGFLGDTVLLAPTLGALKTAYPQAGLHVLTTPVGAEVFTMAACVERSWAMELQPEKRTLRSQWRMIRALRQEKFDVAFNFSGADRSIFMTALTGARWRIAYPGGRQHFWNTWLIRNWAPRQDSNKYLVEQRRRVLEACGMAPGPARFDLRVDGQSAEWGATVVPHPAIHISINASKPLKEWPLDHYAAMLREVWAKSPDLAVVASSGTKERERRRLDHFADLVKDRRLRVLPETLTIRQLAAVLTRCRLHVGPDSGVLHLAVALGVPTISFIREQGAYRSFIPVGPGHQVISMPCRCVDHQAAPCEQSGRADCFARIEPARVAALISEQLVAS